MREGPEVGMIKRWLSPPSIFLHSTPSREDRFHRPVRRFGRHSRFTGYTVRNGTRDTFGILPA